MWLVDSHLRRRNEVDQNGRGPRITNPSFHKMQMQTLWSAVTRVTVAQNSSFFLLWTPAPPRISGIHPKMFHVWMVNRHRYSGLLQEKLPIVDNWIFCRIPKTQRLWVWHSPLQVRQKSNNGWMHGIGWVSKLCAHGGNFPGPVGKTVLETSFAKASVCDVNPGCRAGAPCSNSWAIWFELRTSSLIQFSLDLLKSTSKLTCVNCDLQPHPPNPTK